MQDEGNRAFSRLWVACTLFTVYAATLPFNLVSDTASVRQHVESAIQRSQFSELAALSRADLLQNLLLFVPFGMLGLATVGRKHRFGALAVTVGLAALLSGACELLQLLTVDRVSSLWDVWANVAGALLGGCTWLVAEGVARRMERRVADTPAFDLQQLYPLACTALLVCVAAWEPFDPTLDVSTVWGKVKPFVEGGAFAWRPITDELLSGLRFGLLAWLLAQWMRSSQRDRWRPPVLSAAICALLAVALESTQFLVTSRSPSVQDLVAALAGTMTAVSIAPVITRDVRRPMLITIATVIAAVPFYLQPFELAPAHQPFGFIPFLAYYEFTSLQTVSHVIELMLVYAPIGFAVEWSLGSGRRNDSLRAALVTGAIALSLEYAQGWIIGRFADVTDVGVAILGGIAGAAIARRGVEMLGMRHDAALGAAVLPSVD